MINIFVHSILKNFSLLKILSELINLVKVQFIQLLLAPIMEVKLQIFREFAIAKSVYNSSQFFSANPWMAVDVDPHLKW